MLPIIGVLRLSQWWTLVSVLLGLCTAWQGKQLYGAGEAIPPTDWLALVGPWASAAGGAIRWAWEEYRKAQEPSGSIIGGVADISRALAELLADLRNPVKVGTFWVAVFRFAKQLKLGPEATKLLAQAERLPLVEWAPSVDNTPPIEDLKPSRKEAK
jgi:hypothetical protein